MASRIRLPRAPGPGPMTVDAADWDHLCDVVEWLSGLSVGKPLAKHDTPTGPVITASLFLRPPSLLKVVSTMPGGGWYNAKLWLPPSTAPNPSSNLTEAQLGTQGDDCYYANLREVGSATHDLVDSHNTKQFLFVGLPWGQASDGKTIYLGGDPWLEDCSS